MRNILLLSGLLLGSMIPMAADTIEINPGELAEKLPAAAEDGTLVLSGRGDVRDLLTIRALPATISKIDLSGIRMAELAAQAPTLMGKSYFNANRLPAYSLFHLNCSQLLLPAGLQAIEEGALAGSEITELVVPEGVTEIGDYALYGCPNLKKVVLPSTLRHIGKGAFSGCPALESIDLESTEVTVIPDNCFSGDSSLKEALVSTIHTIGSEAFSATSIVSLLLPEVAQLAPYALAGMDQLREVVLNKDASFAAGTLMNNRNLISLEGVPSNVPALFAANCITLSPEGIISGADTLGDFSFANTGISSIVLGKNLSTVGASVFAGATELTHIDATELGSDIPATEEDAFDGIDPSEVRLKVAGAALDLWQQHPQWGQFQVYQTDLTTVDEIKAVDSSMIGIRLQGNEIVVSAALPIERITIYDTAGRLLHQAAPAAEEARIATEDINAAGGVMIVSAQTAEASSTAKLIL